jgi:spore maturation protein CgeB
MPLATNPERFAPRPANRELQADLLFVGNNWGVRRSIEDLLPAVAPGRVVQVYGRDWESTELADFYHGNLDYDRLSDAYASARIVLDDTAGPTMPYGAVNARVFDAIATGALVISDNEAGVRELFGDDFPVARDADELEARIAWAEADPSAAAELQERMRQIVLERHTYKHRAIELRDHLLNWVDAERYAILIGIPDWEQAPAWGDYHFARGLQRQLERRGHPTRIHLLEEWNRAPSARADVAVHLHGLSDHRPRPSQLNALWIISHPDRISPQVCDRYDIVFVASQTFAAGLAGRVRVPVVTLEQATDPERFVPDPTGPIHDLLFVANTRGVRRAIVDDLLPTVHELAIYGQGWTAEIVDPVHVRADHVPNDVLNRYYSSARVVLNDHWPDMRANGFLSNRLYDALACGACVISDEVVGLDETFEGTILSYKDRDELRRLVDMYLSDAEARRALGERGRAIVLERHTFGHRIDQLLAAIAGLEQSRPMRIESWSEIDAWIGRRRRRTSESMSAPSRDLPGLSIASGR